MNAQHVKLRFKLFLKKKFIIYLFIYKNSIINYKKINLKNNKNYI